MIRSNLTRSWLHPLTLASVFALAGTFAAGRATSAQSLISGTDTGAGPNVSAYTLFNFQSSAPGTTTTVGTVTPTAGYVLTGIAFQPSTDNLYGFEYNGTSGANLGQLVTNNGATLHDIDYANSALATQNLTTDVLTTVGSLGFTATRGASLEGFTIGLGNASFLNSTNAG